MQCCYQFCLFVRLSVCVSVCLSLHTHMMESEMDDAVVLVANRTNRLFPDGSDEWLDGWMEVKTQTILFTLHRTHNANYFFPTVRRNATQCHTKTKNEIPDYRKLSYP